MKALKAVAIRCEAFPGSNLAEAAGESLRLADQIGAPAEFDFNGITCRAYPGGTVDMLLHAWDAVAKARRDAQALVATSRGLSAPEGA